MQTFLPYADFKESAKVLDYRRLGKQRVEAFQLINILDGKTKSKGWVNHPALKMWIGHSEALKLYCNIMITEWIARGYKNTMKLYEVDNPTNPKWIGSENFHSSHRSALLFKDPFYYSQFGWEEQPKLDYIWPAYK